jgi:hypothetical protein
MIDITCKCGEVFHADESLAGNKIRCSKCSTILTIQLPAPPITSGSDQFKTPPFTDNKSQQATRKPRAGTFNADLKRAEPFLIILLVVVVVVAGLLNSHNESTPYNSNSSGNNTGSSENRPASGNVFSDTTTGTSPSRDDGSVHTTPIIPNLRHKDFPQPSSNSANSNRRSYSPRVNHKWIDPFANWAKVDLRTGTSPDCFNFTPTYDLAIDNELEIKVGSNTDVVIKLCSYTTGRCIRYVYIRRGQTFTITHIPQDRYYTKIAYGTDWRQKVVDEQCVGRFVHNALYKKGNQALDFHEQYNGTTDDGNYETTHYTVPSYSLSLDVVATDFDPNIYHTNSITEDEFNK